MSEQQELWQTIKDKAYCDPMRRMDFVLLFDVRDGNPNGDPDAGNLPRMDPMTREGIVTDVCIKRKIRDYLANVLECSIYIQSEFALNTLYFRAAREVDAAKRHVLELDLSGEHLKHVLTFTRKSKNIEPTDDGLDAVRDWLADVEVEGLEYHPSDEKLTYFGEAKNTDSFKGLLGGDRDETPGHLPEKAIDLIAKALADAKKEKGGAKLGRDVREQVKAKMCELYDDIRLFGAVLTAGTNAGQIRGPMQFKFARSVQPILQQDAAITRCAITKESDRARKETEFGRKAWLSYAAYRQHGYFNSPLAEQTGVSRDDLARFWEAVAGMFPNSQSASKGEMATQDLLVFVHPNSRGNAPAHRLLDRVKVNNNRKPRLGFGDKAEEDDDALIQERGIEVCRPLRDLWGDL